MKRTAIIFMVALGAVVAVAVARASVPASDGIIYGCYGNASQPAGVRGNVTVRINAPSEACPFNYTPFQWNEQGIQGPPGPQGIQGVPGQNGKDGKDGTDGDENAQPIYMCPEAGSNATTTFVKWMHAKCPANRAGDTLVFEAYHGSGS